MNEVIRMLDVEALFTRAVEYIPRVVAAAVVVIAFWLAFRILRRLLNPALSKMDMHDAIRDLLVDKLLRYAILLMGVVMAADQLGFNVGAALAGLGVAGIALGFAAQDSVANVIAGILIFWDKPFSVDDWIKTEGEYGQVSEITLRSTRIRTARNTFVVLPNKRIIDVTLENFSRHGALRVDVPLGIAYKEDIVAARHVLLKAVSGLEDLSAAHAPDVVVTGLGDSSVNLAVRVWIDSGDMSPTIYSRVLEASKIALDAAGIQIPFPHLQLFVDDVRDRVWTGLSGTRGLSVSEGGASAD
jgi:small-conductance mechanosensitive channel